ncbi:MAG TPA: hypothetical protein VIL65_09460 [Beijerinckiaceae bacterium]|jgi:hypothetical protein
MHAVDSLVEAVVTRGDLAHLALLFWASAATGGARHLLKELARANERFDAFVREFARVNRRLIGDE